MSEKWPGTEYIYQRCDRELVFFKGLAWHYMVVNKEDKNTSLSCCKVFYELLVYSKPIRYVACDFLCVMIDSDIVPVTAARYGIT